MTNKLAITLVLFSTSAAAAGGLLSAGQVLLRKVWRTAPVAAPGVYLLLGVLSGIALTVSCAAVYRAAFEWTAVLWSTSLSIGPSILAYVASMVAGPDEAWTVAGMASIVWPTAVALLVVLPFRMMPTSMRLAINSRARASQGASVGLWRLSLLILGLTRTATARVFGRFLGYGRRVRFSLSMIEGRMLSRRGPSLLVTPRASRSGNPAIATAFARMAVAAATVAGRRMSATGIFGQAQRPVDSSDPATSPDLPTAGKYSRSSLARTRQVEIASRLDATMCADSLHRDPLLSLPSLAARISVTPNHLSQVLNEHLGQSFFDYVNLRRVEDAVTRIRTTDQPILTIAFDVGFNSRSTFNAAVKKHTGRPPSAFRRELQADHVRIHPPGQGNV